MCIIMYCYIVSAQLYLLQNNKYGKRRTSYKLLYNVVIKRNNLKEKYFLSNRYKNIFLPTISKIITQLYYEKQKGFFFWYIVYFKKIVCTTCYCFTLLICYVCYTIYFPFIFFRHNFYEITIPFIFCFDRISMKLLENKIRDEPHRGSSQKVSPPPL